MTPSPILSSIGLSEGMAAEADNDFGIDRRLGTLEPRSIPTRYHQMVLEGQRVRSRFEHHAPASSEPVAIVLGRLPR